MAQWHHRIVAKPTLPDLPKPRHLRFGGTEARHHSTSTPTLLSPGSLVRLEASDHAIPPTSNLVCHYSVDPRPAFGAGWQITR